MVNDKFQVRTTGPVHNLTQQPIKGRKRAGGIRLGEMERDSLLAHGTSFLLQDRLMNCSDYSQVCHQFCSSIEFIQQADLLLRYTGVCMSIMWLTGLAHLYKDCVHALQQTNV